MTHRPPIELARELVDLACATALPDGRHSLAATEAIATQGYALAIALLEQLVVHPADE